MAYSDYGGFGYRNGEKVIERSDAVLTPEGMKSTPGQCRQRYPLPTHHWDLRPRCRPHRGVAVP